MHNNKFQRPLWKGAVALLTLYGAQMAWGANYPCSGRKGGVSHCQGETFVCNDGSVSGSKKICSAAPVARGIIGSSAATGDCSCRSGSICTGPRGGRYCLSDSGRKSYLRH